MELLSSIPALAMNCPYVILGGLIVDTNVTLTIDKGARIYLHADAPLIVDGTLSVTGTKNRQCYFHRRQAGRGLPRSSGKLARNLFPYFQ